MQLNTDSHLGVQAWDEDRLYSKEPIIEADLFRGVISHGPYHHHVPVPRV